MKKITYIEELLLAIYLELFSRWYDPTDDRVCVLNPPLQIPTRHMEMQNIIYILQCLGVELPNYGFSWQGLVPCSLELELTLNKIDEKGYEAVEEFYIEYTRRRYQRNYNSYTSQLMELMKEYFKEGSICKIANSSLTLENILIQEEGSKTVAAMIYAMHNSGNVDDGYNELNDALKALQSMGWTTLPSPELTQNIWSALGHLGFREEDYLKEVKVFINKKTRTPTTK